jgi:transcriptional regulator with XRE-family HTH domain
VHVSDADMDGAELRRLRRGCGLTAEELATAIDMDGSYVEDMERGTFPITRPAALALRFVLDRIGL